MKGKLIKAIRYLLLAIPFLIYLGLDLVFAAAITIIYMICYINAYFYYCISNDEFNPHVFRYIEIVAENMQEPLTELMMLILPLLSAAFFFFWYKKLIRNDKPSPAEIKLYTFKNIIILLLAGCGMQLLTGGMLELILPHFEKLAAEYAELMESVETDGPVLTFLSVVIVAPISEELTFRGVILKKALKISPFAAANIIQAALFGLAHMNIVQGTYAFVAGLVLGYVAYKYKTIKASILLHMIFNGLNFILVLPAAQFYNVIYAVTGLLLTAVALCFIRNADRDLMKSSEKTSA